MTAPDRLFMFEGYLPNDIRWMESKEGIGEEYIRKGAFPVEELREALDDRYGPETAVAFRAEYKLMERILSLLEGSE